MALYRLLPNSYYSSGYFTSHDVTNAYTDIDSNTYAYFTGTKSEGSNATVMLYGFDLTQIPAEERVVNVVAKTKVELVGTKGSYAQMRFFFKPINGTSPMSTITYGYTSGVETEIIDATVAQGGDAITWADIVNNATSDEGYYSSPNIHYYFTLNNTKTLRIYGAELDVYTWGPSSHGIFNLILPRG